MTRRELAIFIGGATLASAADKGFKPLFNGKDLTGWTLIKGQGKGYLVEKNVLVCPEDGGGNLFTEKEYSDFVLRLDWRLWEGGNNGVGIRSPLEGDAAYQGMEIQILDETSEKYKKGAGLKPAQMTGSVYQVFAAKSGHVKRDGAWNTYEIEARGRKIKVTLNSVVVTDADLDTVKDEALLKQHPGLARKSGHIGFLGHGTRVEFRDIRIKEL